MLCMKNVLNVMEGATRVRDKFRGRGFTSPEYNANRRKGSVALQTLVSLGIVEVVTEEKFTVEVETRHPKTYVTNQAGKIVMEADDYENLPKSTKELLIKTNGGVELNTIKKNTEEIESKRFFYAFNADGYKNYLRNISVALEFKIADKEQELDKLKADLDKVEKEMR